MTRKIVLNTLVMLLSVGLLLLLPLAVPSVYAADILSPSQQMDMGLSINEIQCPTDRILMESPSGKPYCLSQSTASKLSDKGFLLVELEQQQLLSSSSSSATANSSLANQPLDTTTTIIHT